MQDAAVQETMGPIVDHARERLGTSDVAIIRLRRRMLESVERFMEGRRPDRAREPFDYANLTHIEQIADRDRRALARRANVPRRVQPRLASCHPELVEGPPRARSFDYAMLRIASLTMTGVSSRRFGRFGRRRPRSGFRGGGTGWQSLRCGASSCARAERRSTGLFAGSRNVILGSSPASTRASSR